MRRSYRLLLLSLILLAACGKTDTAEQESDFKIGYMYEHGIGVTADPVEALLWYRKAAEGGLAQAQYNMGVMLMNGEGVQKNIEEAISWFAKAAEQGLAQAQFNLANAYRTGEGIEQNYTLALNWYNKAAMQGFTAAQFNLGAMNGNGEGTPQNYVEAYKWLLLASKLGYNDATKYKENFRPSLTEDVQKQVQDSVEKMMETMPIDLFFTGSGTIAPRVR